MKEIFDFKRFGKYLVYDLNHVYARYGLSLLIMGLLPLVVFLVTLVLSPVTGGKPWYNPDVYQSLTFIALLIVSLIFGARVYGIVTEKKAGTAWIILPASALEKTLSLLLITCVLLPACLLSLLFFSNWIVSLFVPNVDPLETFRFLGLDGWGLAVDGFGDVNVPLMAWLAWCEGILVFTLGALCFKRTKVGKTFLCLFGLSILASFLMMAIFNTTSFNGEMFERFFEDFDEARAQRWLNVGLNLFHGGVMAALIAGIWVRIKTIKA